MEVEMFKAGHGDCFLLCLKKNDNTPFNILIDGGTASAFNIYIKKELFKFLQNNTIDLLIVTHSDNDHIMGVLKFVQKLQLEDKKINNMIKRVIINYRENVKKMDKIMTNNADTSGEKEKDLVQILMDEDLLEEKVFINDGSQDIEEEGISIAFLTPNKEIVSEYFTDNQSRMNQEETSDTKGADNNNDYGCLVSELMNDTTSEKLNMNNRISIALLIKEASTTESILMLGDSEYCVVKQKLSELGFSKENKLRVDYVKLSHHGSICDLDKDFLNTIQCNKYLISTDGLGYQHPDKKTLARIWSVNTDAEFLFNYPERIELLFTNKEELVYKQKCKKYGEE